MEPEHAPFSVVAVLEDVLQQHYNTRLSDNDLASRRADEASLQRYEAAEWLRNTVGAAGVRDFLAQPSEEDFRLGLRSGIILCNALNKVQHGAVPKVVESPSDSIVVPDGAALSAFQYFENVRNFLVAVEELGLPTFDASDLDKGGKTRRIVNCVLALKSYSEWKQNGGNGTWRYGVNMKTPTSGTGKPFIRKSSEPFMTSISRSFPSGGKSVDSSSSEPSSDCNLGQDLSAGSSDSINALLRACLVDKRREEIPIIVESILKKVMEEFQRRLAIQNELMKNSSKDALAVASEIALSETLCKLEEIEETATTKVTGDEHQSRSETHPMNQHVVEKQKSIIQELKQALYSTKAGMQYMEMKFQDEFSNMGKHLRGLAYAATGYGKVLEENRKLYNQVQDLKGNIRVYCRVRPFLPGQAKSLSTVDHIEEGTIKILVPSKNGKVGRKQFTFNKVFGPLASQEEVFSDTQPLVRSVVDGYNVCIFAYGQTGSGKTYTMTGPMELTEESMGVNYRALTDLFLLLNEMKDTICYDISVQMLEIYNEQVRDLLASDGQNRRLDIRNSSQSGINVPDANLVPVSSTSDVVHLIDIGQKNRAMGATAMNDRSSRSHSCLTVHVQGRDLTSGATIRGSMHLVDLAGSERVLKSEARGDRLKEAQHINKSLSALGDVIAALAQRSSHVPYRNSKLTQLLQDSLGGQAKTLMFVHISPEPEALGETISTLKFAERASTVELGAARVNKDSVHVKELKEQIVLLKTALAATDREAEEHILLQNQKPEDYRRRSLGSSSLHSHISSLGDDSCGRKQQMDDSSGAKSSSWRSPSLDGNNDDGGSVSSDCMDSVMGSKNSSGNWAVEPRKLFDQSPQIYKQNHEEENPDGNQDSEARTGQNEEAEDCGEAASCEYSETASMLQVNDQVDMPKVANISSASSPKMKRSQPKPSKKPEARSLIPSLIPPPTRKLPGSSSSHAARPAPRHVMVEGKHRSMSLPRK